MPEAVVFTTKPKLGLLMLERARAAGVPFSWVAGDSVYGADHAIRRWAERHRRGYVLAVTSGQRLGFRPVTTWIEDLPETAWQRLSAGEGAKGPRLYDWAYVPYRGGAEGFRCGLLVRRSVVKLAELTFHLTHAPEGILLSELVRVAGSRWNIESLFEQAKSLPPDLIRVVRSASISMRCAPGWVGTATSRSRCLRSPTSPPSAGRLPGGADPISLAAELLPLTVPEVRRLLWALAGQRPSRPVAALRWSAWRRRHQQRARRAHWHRRTQGQPHDPRL